MNVRAYTLVLPSGPGLLNTFLQRIGATSQEILWSVYEEGLNAIAFEADDLATARFIAKTVAEDQTYHLYSNHVCIARQVVAPVKSFK